MGTQYAGDPLNFPDDYTIPDDSDPPTAAAINIGLEALGDRTAWLKTHIDANNAFRTPLANFAALKAVAAPTDKLGRFVEGYGAYFFDTSSVLAEVLPWVVSPADATPGRWIRAGNRVRNGRRLLSAAADFQTTLSSNQTARSKTADFVPTARDSVHRNFAVVRSGGIFMPFASDNTGGLGYTFGFQWCIDRVLTHGATLTAAMVGVVPATGRPGLPTTPFSIGVFRSPGAHYLAAPALESLWSGGDFYNDPFAISLGFYEGPHTFDVACDQHQLVDLENYSYYVQFWNESGANCFPSNVISGLLIHQDNLVDAELR